MASSERLRIKKHVFDCSAGKVGVYVLDATELSRTD